MISAAGHFKSFKTTFRQLTFIVLILSVHDIFARQSATDSVEYILNSDNIKDSAKVSILLKLFQEYLPDQSDKAKQVANQAIEFLEKKGDAKGKREAYFLLSQSYRARKKFSEASNIAEKLLETDEQSGDLDKLAEDLLLLGTIYQEKKDFSNSLDQLEKAAAIYKTTGSKELIRVYEKIIEVYTEKNDFRRVYDYYQLLLVVSDSLTRHENQSHLDEIKLRYETEKKENEIVDLSKDNALKENEIKRYAIIRNAFIIAFVLIFITAILLFRMIRLKRNSNRLLKERNNRINMEKREVELEKNVLENYSHNLQKENILAQYETLKNQVNPHFLFNSLTSLSTLIVSDPEKAIEFTNEFSKVYRYVLELKENLVIKVMEELSLINSYLFLQEIRFEKNLSISIDIKSEYLDCFIPPFSLQLLVDNVIKHNAISSKSPLKISIYSEGDFLVVKNGIGKQPENVISTGVGIKNLLDRYDIVSEIRPEFLITETEYIARIPIIRED